MKDCKITFTDGRADYPFSSDTSLGLILKTAKERGWSVDSIHTPDYVLSVFDREKWGEITSDSFFTDVGV